MCSSFFELLRHADAKTEGRAAVDICKLRSEDGSTAQLVAVKRLKPNAAVNLHELANEGKILRTLRHRCAHSNAVSADCH